MRFHLSLQKNILLIVIASVGVLLFVTLLALKVVLFFGLESESEATMRGFQAIEASLVEKELRRIQTSFQSEILKLETSSVDWAQWDDIWYYVANHNSEFERSNFQPNSFKGKGISHLYVFDKGNQKIGGICLQDCDNQNILSLFPTNSPIFKFKSSSDVHSGILPGKQWPLMFVVRPIIKSDGSGEAHGSILFSSIVDSAFINRFSQNTGRKIRIEPYFQRAENHHWPHFHEVNDTCIQGDILVRDYFNNPRFRITFKMDRPVYREAQEANGRILQIGKNTRIIYTIGIILCSILLCFVLSYFLSQKIIRRIRILSESISAVGSGENFAHQIPDLGSDEIGQLSRHFRKMLATIALNQQQIHVQNLERKAILDALPTGIISIDASFCICGTPSFTAQNLLGSDCAGKPFCAALGLSGDEEKKLLDFLDVFVQELLPHSELTALNPFPEIQIKKTIPCWVRIMYYKLPHGRNPQINEPVMLAVLEDITLMKQKSNELQACLLENNWLRAILADPDLFLEFFRESEQALVQIERSISGKTDRTLVARAFRHAHTIQGSALGFGLHNLSSAAIVLENHLGLLLQAIESNDDSKCVLEEEKERAYIEPLRTAISIEKNKLQQIISQQSMDWKAGPSLRLPLHKLREWSALLASGEHESVQHSLEDCFHLPLRKILQRTLLWFPGMVSRSDKNVRLELEGDEIQIPIDWTGLLNDILVHLLRNSVAHGIETVEERLLLGKPEQGLIRIICQKDGDHLEIRIEDDGKGFEVDIQKAFLLGFSSLSTSTSLAGKGIGLNAVKAMVEELGGRIEISSVPNKGSKFYLTFDTSPKVML